MSNTKNVTPLKDTSPGLLLRKILDDEDDIESIIVTCHRKSTNMTHTYHTRATYQDLIWLVSCMQDEVNKEVYGDV